MPPRQPGCSAHCAPQAPADEPTSCLFCRHVAAFKTPLCQKVLKDTPAFWPRKECYASHPQSFQMRCCCLRQRAEQLNVCPILLAPQQRGDGHSRTSRDSPCGVLGITVNQPNRMPLHVPLVADALAGQTDAAQTVPLRNSPAYRPPKGMPAPRRGCRPRKLWRHPRFAAAISYNGRMSAASIRPPVLWPCHPSTIRLSRLPQQKSRRIARASPRPSTRRAPHLFSDTFSGYAPVHARKQVCHNSTTDHPDAKQKDSSTPQSPD